MGSLIDAGLNQSVNTILSLGRNDWSKIGIRNVTLVKGNKRR